MARTPYGMQSFHHKTVYCHAAVLGAGAAPPTVPTTRPQDNLAASAARSGVGAYTVTLREPLLNVLDIIPMISGAGTLGQRAQVSGSAIVGGVTVITVTCYTAAGVAYELVNGVDT